MVHEHMHRLVQRAADGSKIIPLVKRDDYSDNIHNFIHRLSHNTNADNIKLNVPAGFALKAETSSEDTSSNNDSSDTNNNGVAVEVKYVTASASFSGSTLGFVTDMATSTPAATQTSVAAITPASVSSSAITSSAVAVTSANAVTPAVGTPVAQSRTSASPGSSSAADSSKANADLSASQQQQNGGLTDAAKAGLAIGIILAIALVAGLIFFCWKRAKRNNSSEEYNEKHGYSEKRSSFFGAGSNGSSKRRSADSDKSFGTIHNTATAPRLSLRPVTQFLPAAFSEKRKSSMQNNPQMSERNAGWERRPQNGENPFRDPAAAPAQNPFDEGDGSSQHSSKKNSWDAPATPNSAQFGTAAAVPVAAMNAQGPPRVQNNVHRVQLDFKPSMDDELELKSGQLVRLLHEYDDGWALCIRMDRSQQGVAPRTCLSKTPVKPRGPPSGRTSPQGSVRGPPQSPVARKPVPGQAI